MSLSVGLQVAMTTCTNPDAVTERIRLSMDEDVAGLNDADNLALEEVEATADEAIEDKWPGGRISESMKANTEQTPL